jgi:hypothetical protein
MRPNEPAAPPARSVAAESIAIVRSAVAAVAGMMFGLFAPLVAATAEPDYAINLSGAGGTGGFAP